MPRRPSSPRASAPLARRAFLRTGAAAAVGASVLSGRRLAGATRPRIGIVGGGLAGISCAWLLDGVADTVLFESRAEIGGHAHTIPVDVAGETIQVDVGAQFFAPGPHPTYLRLLQVLGLFDPAHPEADATIETRSTITITEAGAETPRFVSPAPGRQWPIFTPWNRAALVAFLVFTRAASRLVKDGDWLLTLEDWLADLRVGAAPREHVLLPLLSAMTGCSMEQALAHSARAAVLFIAEALPAGLLDPVLYGNSLLGLQGNAIHLAAACHDLTVHTSAAVTRVRPRPGGGFRVEHGQGVEDVDVVVLANPPYASGPLLAEIPEQAEAAAVLAQFEYFSADIAIHRDPMYMPARRRHWSSYNVHTDGAQAEGSVWYGALREEAPSRRSPLLFKSWATARSQPPADEIFRRTFRHPLITPDFLRLQERLREHQGRAGVWFAGSYTREVDSQETALRSAIDVARALAPAAPNLLALEP